MAVLYTIGHSNRPLADFLALLAAHSIRALADVRAFPASRRWPHFNREPLAAALAEQSIAYTWIPELGGRRRKLRSDSPHRAWKIEAFRHYADYMDTPGFEEGLRRLLELAETQPTAVQCAEALYWQCHRRLIADALVVHGHEVLHIQTPTRAEPHKLPAFARVADGRLIYDAGTQLEML